MTEQDLDLFIQYDTLYASFPGSCNNWVTFSTFNIWS